MATITNIMAQPAYKGTGVRVRIDAANISERETFDLLNVGDSITSPSAVEGKIYSKDIYGYSFVAIPNMPTESFSGVTNCVLSDGDTITINF